MNAYLDALAEVLEAESAVGEELCRNLAAQRNALVAWDIADLLGRIEAREPWLRLLGDLEQQRLRLLKQSAALGEPAALRQVIGRLPESSAQRSRLTDVRERSRMIFTRLQAGERDFHRLMENLAALIQEALNPLLKPAVPTYGESGVAERQKPASGLLQSKA